MAATKMTRKGQVTIPIEIRQKLHLEEGDILAVREEDGKVVLESQREVLARTLEMFATNALVPILTPDDMDDIVAEAIVEDYFDSVKDR